MLKMNFNGKHFTYEDMKFLKHSELSWKLVHISGLCHKTMESCWHLAELAKGSDTVYNHTLMKLEAGYYFDFVFPSVCLSELRFYFTKTTDAISMKFCRNIQYYAHFICMSGSDHSSQSYTPL